MSIFKLIPTFKDYGWGGETLKRDYNKQTDLLFIAESWEVSTHPKGQSRLSETLTLQEYIANKGSSILGTHSQAFHDFPILVKFIDAKETLSMQVGAMKLWYVLESSPNAYIYYGTHEPFSQEWLQQVAVEKGDAIFIPEATFHALGSGLMICEIQQNTTTHNSDSNNDSNYEQESALNQVFKAETEFQECGAIKKRCLCQCPYFRTDEIIIKGVHKYSLDMTSFEVLVVVEGVLTVLHRDEKVILHKGESLFVDADTHDITCFGEARYLMIRV